MAKLKNEILQVRIDTELLERFKRYADAQGYHLSVALRHTMKQMCDNYESYLARQDAQRQRELNK